MPFGDSQCRARVMSWAGDTADGVSWGGDAKKYAPKKLIPPGGGAPRARILDPRSGGPRCPGGFLIQDC